MANFVLPGRAAKGRRPFGPVILNDQTPQAQGLVAWYPIGSDLLANAAALPARLATNNAVTQVGSSQGGLVGSFNGTTSYLQRTVGTQAVTAPPFSVVAWGFPTTVAGTAQQFWSCIDSSFFGWYLFINASNKLDFQTYNGTAGDATTTGSVVANQWNHVVGVTASIASRAVYLNGVDKGTNSSSLTVTQNASLVRESVGCYDQGGSRTNFFGGLLGDIRVYNRALTDMDAWLSYDPAHRYDLYWMPSTKTFFDLATTFNAATFPFSAPDTLVRAPVLIRPSGRVA